MVTSMTKIPGRSTLGRQVTDRLDLYFLTRRGRHVAAVIDADDLQRLIEAAENLADIEAARAARAEIAETGEAAIPRDQVKGRSRPGVSYRIDFAPAAVRQLRKLGPAARRRIQAAVELLSTDPRPAGAKQLVGGDGEWRVRTGDYRIVYEIHDRLLLVLVVAVGRRDIFAPAELIRLQIRGHPGENVKSGLVLLR
jgi:mRNA interferase RelE/StbE